MTKKNIRPQQVAPVQRETVGTNSSAAATVAGGGWGVVVCTANGPGLYGLPFAGDDAE